MSFRVRLRQLCWSICYVVDDDQMRDLRWMCSCVLLFCDLFGSFCCNKQHTLFLRDDASSNDDFVLDVPLYRWVVLMQLYE